MTPPITKKITGLLYPSEEKDLYEWVKRKLQENFGDIEIESEHFPFTWTDYYAHISPMLNRCFFCFAGLHHASQLPDWKNLAIEIEAMSGSSRTVNIDPGYVDGARLVLASTKDHAHRIYLRDKVFAEVTLSRKQKKWIHYSYTFPDFRSLQYHAFLSEVSEKWKKEVKCFESDVFIRNITM